MSPNREEERLKSGVAPAEKYSIRILKWAINRCIVVQNGDSVILESYPTMVGRVQISERVHLKHETLIFLDSDDQAEILMLDHQGSQEFDLHFECKIKKTKCSILTSMLTTSLKTYFNVSPSIKH